MLRIALTGGIGSGKTTVAQIFEVLSVPVYYADRAAKFLMNTDELLKKQIIAAFGPDVYKDGKLDRSLLGKLVFSDADELARLNALVHPVTLRDAEAWMQNQNSPYAIKEAAIIFEAGIEKFFDYIIGVSAPEHLRLERVMNRDQTSAENVLRRMAQQMDENEKISRCDFVVVNDGIRALLPQVLQIHESLLAI
jgi:dephospho-CoA kinase